MILGITGGTGCGKTTALRVLQDLGAIILDCDAIYHDLLRTDKKLLAAIEARFPVTVIDGQLERKKLGAIVFSDDAALLAMVYIIAPYDVTAYVLPEPAVILPPAHGVSFHLRRAFDIFCRKVVVIFRIIISSE